MIAAVILAIANLSCLAPGSKPLDIRNYALPGDDIALSRYFDSKGLEPRNCCFERTPVTYSDACEDLDIATSEFYCSDDLSLRCINWQKIAL